MEKITKRMLAVVMVLALALTCVMAAPADVQAASTKSLSVKGPKETLIQWNVADDEGSAISTNVKVTVQVLSVGKNAKSVKITDWTGKTVLKISGKNLKKGYKKTCKIKNEYGTERVLMIDGNVKIKITLKPTSGKISFFEETQEAG